MPLDRAIKGYLPAAGRSSGVFSKKLHSSPKGEERGAAMSKKHLIIGDAAWVAQVFASPAARPLKGHSRRTQHHRYFSSQLNAIVGVQGRNELCTALAIEYLICLGLLKRAKPQPFITDKEQFGSEICPDFLAEATESDLSLFVIETKSARFLTRLKNCELDDYRDRFARFGIRYLVWTDQRPLNHSVRHNLQKMRAAANRDVSPAEVERLVTWVGQRQNVTISDCYQADFDLDCIYAAAWKCKVFFPISRALTAETSLTCHPQEDYKAFFLNCLNSVEDWWQALPNF